MRKYDAITKKPAFSPCQETRQERETNTQKVPQFPETGLCAYACVCARECILECVHVHKPESILSVIP